MKNTREKTKRLAARIMGSPDGYIYSDAAFVDSALDWLGNEVGTFQLQMIRGEWALSTSAPDAWVGTFMDESKAQALAMAIVELGRLRGDIPREAVA